jgi:hypothetical protein
MFFQIKNKHPRSKMEYNYIIKQLSDKIVIMDQENGTVNIILDKDGLHKYPSTSPVVDTDPLYMNDVTVTSSTQTSGASVTFTPSTVANHHSNLVCVAGTSSAHFGAYDTEPVCIIGSTGNISLQSSGADPVIYLEENTQVTKTGDATDPSPSFSTAGGILATKSVEAAGFIIPTRAKIIDATQSFCIRDSTSTITKHAMATDVFDLWGFPLSPGVPVAWLAFDFQVPLDFVYTGSLTPKMMCTRTTTGTTTTAIVIELICHFYKANGSAMTASTSTNIGSYSINLPAAADTPFPIVFPAIDTTTLFTAAEISSGIHCKGEIARFETTGYAGYVLVHSLTFGYSVTSL